jgi:glutamate racemase
VHLTSQECPRFVEFVEAGITSGPELMAVAHEYLDPVRAAGVDTLVLGCTHYPLLTGVISYVMGEDVTLVSSAEETAKDVYRTLVAHDLERDPTAGPPEHRFVATGDPVSFQALAHRFLGPEVGSVEALGARR